MNHILVSSVGVNLNLCVRKQTIRVPTRSDTNRAVQAQAQKQARSLKFKI